MLETARRHSGKDAHHQGPNLSSMPETHSVRRKRDSLSLVSGLYTHARAHTHVDTQHKETERYEAKNDTVSLLESYTKNSSGVENTSVVGAKTRNLPEKIHRKVSPYQKGERTGKRETIA